MIEVAKHVIIRSIAQELQMNVVTVWSHLNRNGNKNRLISEVDGESQN